MSLLQRNATLLRVQGAGAGERYDASEGAGPDKWGPFDVDAGADAYVKERRDRTSTAGGEARTIDRKLIVEAALPVEWRSGDTVTFRRTKSAADETAKVRLVERPEIDDPDIDPELQTTRLTLETG